MDLIVKEVEGAVQRGWLRLYQGQVIVRFQRTVRRFPSACKQGFETTVCHAAGLNPSAGSCHHRCCSWHGWGS